MLCHVSYAEGHSHLGASQGHIYISVQITMILSIPCPHKNTAILQCVRVHFCASSAYHICPGTGFSTVLPSSLLVILLHQHHENSTQLGTARRFCLRILPNLLFPVLQNWFVWGKGQHFPFSYSFNKH